MVSSSTAAGVTLGFILGSASAWLVEHAAQPEQVAAWGWRIPFIASVMFFMRRLAPAPRHRRKRQKAQAAAMRPPLFASLVADWLPIVQHVRHRRDDERGLLPHVHVCGRTAQQGAGVSSDAGAEFLLANTLASSSCCSQSRSAAGCRIATGRRRLMMVVTIAGDVLIYPALWLMLYGTRCSSSWRRSAGDSAGHGARAAGRMLVEIFPLRTRVTSMSVAYSITLALAGGTAPLVAAWLVERFEDPLGRPSTSWLYGLIGLALMLPMTETNRRSLGATG